MSWTVVCDLPMKTYHGGQSLDATQFQNHANLIGNLITHSGYVSFQGPDAQLEVPVRDESLARFAGLRIQALIRPAPLTRRFNLVEGWMSFALVIQDDGRLIGTIYDGQTWVAVESGASTVSANEWARVAFEYDGVSLAWLELNGSVVGRRFDMPAIIRQPQQVITLGHWPRGDDRYTFQGDFGHVRIEKRDYEDVGRDAIHTAFCRRRLSPEQAAALHELQFLVQRLSPEQRDRLRTCAKAQAERTRLFLHNLRANNEREVARLRVLADRLRNAWCCTLNAAEAADALREFFQHLSGSPGSVNEQKFQAALNEFFAIATMCSWNEEPYIRMRELGHILFPELTPIEVDLRTLAASC